MHPPASALSDTHTTSNT